MHVGIMQLLCHRQIDVRVKSAGTDVSAMNLCDKELTFELADQDERMQGLMAVLWRGFGEKQWWSVANWRWDEEQ